MLALVAGFFLVSYLLAPGAIYRLAFSFFLPSKRFQRTRTEEIIFSVFSVSVPFLLSWILLCHTFVGHFPSARTAPSKGEAYSQVLEGLLATSPAKGNLVPAYKRALQEQARFIVWLWALCLLEGFYNGWLVSRYGSFKNGSFRKWLCDQFLLKNVSEWQVLFTTITLPANERHKTVEVDVLCSGTLYRGRLSNWFTEQDGKLAGIFLTEAERFRREDLEKDLAAGEVCVTEDYWRKIPGAKLYLAASSIANYNVRYNIRPSRQPETSAAEVAAISNFLGMDILLTPDESTENDDVEG